MCPCGRDEGLSGKPLVTMMEATHLWERDDLTGLGWVYRAALRTILVEREMRSRPVVIASVRRQHAAQMTFIEDDEVIETVAANRADDALDVGVLPGRSWRSNDLLDADGLEAIAEGRTIGRVAVPQHISRCHVPGKGFGYLTGEPDLGRVLRDIEVNDPSPVVARTITA